ncbi:MAG: KOW domain-containing RNA-binding protein [Tissierellaceae bacterium]|nr:KOW domain-containing RNA-binding protein [Tissierellaceae bacterium]
MDTTMDINIGQVVMSKAGRDKGKIFLILDIIDAQYVSVIDGDLRKLDNPKRKKIKHLSVSSTILSELNEKIENNEKIDDAYIRKLLEPYKKSF